MGNSEKTSSGGGHSKLNEVPTTSCGDVHSKRHPLWSTKVSSCAECHGIHAISYRGCMYYCKTGQEPELRHLELWHKSLGRATMRPVLEVLWLRLRNRSRNQIFIIFKKFFIPIPIPAKIDFHSTGIDSKIGYLWFRFQQKTGIITPLQQLIKCKFSNSTI